VPKSLVDGSRCLNEIAIPASVEDLFLAWFEPRCSDSKCLYRVVDESEYSGDWSLVVCDEYDKHYWPLLVGGSETLVDYEAIFADEFLVGYLQACDDIVRGCRRVYDVREHIKRIVRSR
jgi:hypothetical protein